jgi:hypothetical protein
MMTKTTTKRKAVFNGAAVILTLTVTMILGGLTWKTFGYGEPLDGRGGVGDVCYPNDSCDTGLTCFAIRERHQCEMNVQPVFTEGLPSCFLTRNLLGEEIQYCEPTQDECKIAFARVAGKGNIVKGCSR